MTFQNLPRARWFNEISHKNMIALTLTSAADNLPSWAGVSLFWVLVLLLSIPRYTQQIFPRNGTTTKLIPTSCDCIRFQRTANVPKSVLSIANSTGVGGKRKWLRSQSTKAMPNEWGPPFLSVAIAPKRNYGMEVEPFDFCNFFAARMIAISECRFVFNFRRYILGNRQEFARKTFFERSPGFFSRAIISRIKIPRFEWSHYSARLRIPFDRPARRPASSPSVGETFLFGDGSISAHDDGGKKFGSVKKIEWFYAANEIPSLDEILWKVTGVLNEWTFVVAKNELFLRRAFRFL